MHWTTIAKIEKGERSVRIDEAAGIAELIETSVDALPGRAVPDDARGSGERDPARPARCH